jgi:hypothetical protein
MFNFLLSFGFTLKLLGPSPDQKGIKIKKRKKHRKKAA